MTTAGADSTQTQQIGALGYLLEPQPQREIILWRAAVFGATAFSIAGYAYSRMDDWWGHEYGPAHIKHDDWNGDNLAQTDEVSHMVFSYKITQAGTGLAKWTGFSDGVSRIIGVGISGFIMTWVEYPVDAHNPLQGFGYTDMTANIIGISLATARDIWPQHLQGLDLRFSIKPNSEVNDEFIAQTCNENDAFIYWLTYNPSDNFPVHPAIGYSANHNNDKRVAEREVYLGFGTSLAEIAGLIDPRWRSKLDFWSLYELSVAFRIE